MIVGAGLLDGRCIDAGFGRVGLPDLRHAAVAGLLDIGIIAAGHQRMACTE